MEAVGSPSDQAADLLQKLAIDPGTKTIPSPSNKVAPLPNSAGVAAKPNQKSEASPHIDASGYIPNVHPSTAYSYAFDVYGHGNDWNSHSLYFTDEAAESSRGGSPVYHQGYSYVPYGTVGPEVHHYLYPGPYYAHQDSGNGPYGPAQVGNPQCKGNTGPLRSNSEYMASNSNAYYRNGGMYSPLSGVDASAFSDTRFNRETGLGFTSLLTPANSLHPFPNVMSSNKISTSGGLCNIPGLLNQNYPNTALYGQYRNPLSSGAGPFGYDQMSLSYKPAEAISKYRARYVSENTDGLNELNRGPRVKIQNIPLSENNEEIFPSISDKEEYNREDFPQEYNDAKFFVIKSYSEDDVHKSIKYGMWTSTGTGNKKLDAAYREAKEKPNGCPVFLFFSVNTSGQFVGVAEMVGPVDFNRTVEYWQQDKWQGCFPVKWHIIKDVQNSSLRHIKLGNNENKPVTNSRDTQEVEFEQGMEILKIFKDDEGTSSILDDFKFYEDREKKMLEKKAKQDKSQKQGKSLWTL
ncbi:YTH domain-containing protein ECT4-like isoform X1 [Punica granatum]|uniref:YTH domain-containing family protein n=1 Tax=Punica granatum TaxID=22663 RepID=A0A6P8D7C9_PUNGR|nr:YTH domain-containing protein ECT4-like isoform X1 [Punica granatum]